jgi:hypothetical protein
MPNYKLGPGQKQEIQYSDIELNYVNKGFVLQFFHIPSGKSVQFKALLTQIEDRYESEWNKIKVYGRSDAIQVFQGTARTITVGWDVVAASVGEAKDNLQKIGLLNSMLYPTYDKQDGNVSSISASPLFKVSFVNLIRNYGNTTKNRAVALNNQGTGKGNPGGLAQVAGLVGTIGGLAYSPNLESGFFDPPDESGNLYPQTVNLNFTFTVIHTHTVGWYGDSFNPKAGSFPYGKPTDHIEGPSKNDVMNENKRGGTDETQTAQQRKITGGG